MDLIQLRSTSAQETLEIGRSLAAGLRRFELVGLTGGLGSGKTTLVQGICNGLGYRGYVTSPTFNLMHLYPASPPIYHLDCFRIKNQSQLDSTSFNELLSTQHGIVLAEWSELISDYFNEWTIEIALSIVPDEENHRIINFKSASTEAWLPTFRSWLLITAE